MSKRRNEFLSEYVTGQFPISTFKKVIIAHLDLVETFKLMLHNNIYDIKLNSNCEIIIKSPTTSTYSKVESLTIQKYNNMETMRNCILTSYMAFNSLNDLERRVFYCTFFEGKTDLEIIDELRIYSNLLNKIRKSAIVKYTLYCGLDEFKDLF